MRQDEKKIWHELEQTYMPWRDYDGNAFFGAGGYWMQRQHIFINPFYYVDYALAQMGAFHFYRMMDEDPKTAWEEYYRLCRSGGSRGYFETLSTQESEIRSARKQSGESWNFYSQNFSNK